MNKKDLVFISILVFVYIIIIYFTKPELFQYQFNSTLIEKYLHSQDIPREVSDRIFLSDSEIHEAAGYLYAKGEDPTEYNFQHPPFIKYLYGFSTILFNNPYFAQILLGILLISSTYLLGTYVFKSPIVGFLGSLFLLIDPLFIDLSQNLLLDLGQAALLVLYLLTVLKYQKNWLIQGIILGLLCASKFWAAPLFIVGILNMYLLYKKKFLLRSFIKHLVAAGLVFCIIYLQSFIKSGGFFNIVFFELKTFKYWLNHSVSTYFGASVVLFTSGYVSTWWGEKETVRSTIWTFLWPLILTISTVYGLRKIATKKIEMSLLISIVPLLYLLYLGIQAPFVRYFIIILPFLYITTAGVIWKIFRRN